MTAGSPLAGRRVVNTRALTQAGELDRVLEAYGAVPLSFPCIAIGPPADVAALDRAIGRLESGGFDWVVLTSANTVEVVAGRLAHLHVDDTDRHRLGKGALLGLPGSVSDTVDGSQLDPAGHHAGPSHEAASDEQVGPRTREPARGSPTAMWGSSSGVDAEPGSPRRAPLHVRSTANELDGDDARPSVSASERLRDVSPGVQPRATAATKIAAVGAVTADAVAHQLEWPVAFVPRVETAAELGRTLPIAPGDRVLLPQSALAGPALAAILSGRGAEVTQAVAYETTTGVGGVDLVSLLVAGAVDVICLTSGSTARGLLERLAGAGLPGAVRVACIGPETAEAARSLGLRVDVVPARPTILAMVEVLAASFATNETAIRG